MAFVDILLAAGLLLLFAKIFGSVASRFGLSPLVGEIFAGIFLGPVLGVVVAGEFFADMVTLGAIVLLFLAGLEVKYEDIKKNTYLASAIAVGGGGLSFLFGMLIGWLALGSPLAGLAIGTVLVTTSNGTLFRILVQTGCFRTRVGSIVVAATISDDILGIISLAVFSAFVTAGSFAAVDAVKIFLVAVGFYIFAWTAASRAINGFLRLMGKFMDQHILFTVPLAIAFILAYVTENLGLSIATGAFLAGMAMANSQFNESIITPKVNALGYGFLIPLFYATIGTALSFAAVDATLVVLLLAAALAGKFLGALLAGRFAGIASRDSRLIGVLLMPRGNENIVITQLIFALGVISIAVYTSIIYALVITAIITPVLAKLVKE